jgi:hypothetical protein
MAGRDEQAFAAAGGLADDVNSTLMEQLLEQLAQGGFGIGNAWRQARDLAVKVEMVLSNISTEVTDPVDGLRVHG